MTFKLDCMRAQRNAQCDLPQRQSPPVVLAEGVMIKMQNNGALKKLPFGLLELDEAGVVIYYNPDKREDPGVTASDLVGRNLFSAVPVVAQAKEFQDHLSRFCRNRVPADSFPITFYLEQGSIQAKVLLARIHEEKSADSPESILIHIRKV